MSSLCGGIISQTKFKRDMNRYGVWANMMAYILPDKQYNKYISYQKQGKEKEAKKIFDKYAYSQI